MIRRLSRTQALVLGTAFTGTLTLTACSPGALPTDRLDADGRDVAAAPQVDRSGESPLVTDDLTAPPAETDPTPTPEALPEASTPEDSAPSTEPDDTQEQPAVVAEPAPEPEPEPAPAPAPATSEQKASPAVESAPDAPVAVEPTRSSAPAPSDSALDATDAGLSDPSALERRDIRTLDKDGAVLEDVLIDGDLTLSGSNQTLRNVHVTGKLQLRSHGTLVENTELGTLSVSASTDVVIRSVEISGKPGEDGIHVTSGRALVENLLIEGSRIHSPQVTSGSHYDGIQVRGVKGLTLRDNSFELGDWKKQFTAAVFLENANGGNRDVVIEDNYIDGGGYALYLFGKNIEVVDNTFGPSQRWGYVYPSSHMHEVTASGNTTSKGAPVAL